jgi:hypothetical protein|tara:strand:+ start:347 stop:613 length:267 start_codon:yes stop_codon:yes gene_type:complete
MNNETNNNTNNREELINYVSRAEGVSDGVAQTYRYMAEMLTMLTSSNVSKKNKIEFIDELIQETRNHETNTEISAAKRNALKSIRRLI